MPSLQKNRIKMILLQHEGAETANSNVPQRRARLVQGRGGSEKRLSRKENRGRRGHAGGNSFMSRGKGEKL